MNWQPDAPAMRALVRALLNETPTVYAVGGVVRDALLARGGKQTDMDLVVADEALPLAQRAADRLGWAYYPLDEARDVARLVFTANYGEPYVCDISGMRGGTIGEDLRTRDFTINAMAFAIRRLGQVELVDVTGGQADLAARVLRRVSAASLADDPLRLLRAVRFSVGFGLTIELQTQEQIKRMGATLRLTSPERQRDELWKTLATTDPEQAIERMQSLGLLTHVLPEVADTMEVAQSFPHYTDVYSHTLLTVRNAALIRAWLQADVVEEPPRAMWQATLLPWRLALRRHFLKPLASGHVHVDWLIWDALLHDIGKPSTQSVDYAPDGGVRYRFIGHEHVGAQLAAERLTALRFSRGEVARARTVVDAHMRPHHLDVSFTHQPISRRAIYRFYRDVGGDQFEDPPGVDTLLLAIADYQAIHEAAVPPRWDEYLEHIGQMLAYALGDDGLRQLRQAALLDGHTLMAELQLQPGPQIGVLLDKVAEAQASGEILSRDEALDLARGALAREE